MIDFKLDNMRKVRVDFIAHTSIVVGVADDDEGEEVDVFEEEL